MVTLLKTVRLMRYQYTHDDTVRFVQQNEDTDTPDVLLDMPADVWADMDGPREVTVTIVPGDQLNAGG